jgi:hypothetical protein
VAKKPKVLLPVAPLPDLMKWWRSQHTRGLVIGGLAVALLGRPRVTRDVDALILLAEDLSPALIEAGARFGCDAQAPSRLAIRRFVLALDFGWLRGYRLDTLHSAGWPPPYLSFPNRKSHLTDLTIQLNRHCTASE